MTEPATPTVAGTAAPSADPAGASGPESPRHTPLRDRHVALGARLVPFAGWEMPLQYSGIIEEHRTVREAAGLFDLSHMGELWVSGAGAGDALAYALVTDPRRLAVGRAQYSVVCTPAGGIVDDLIVYRTAEQRFLVVPNAANAESVAAALRDRSAGFDLALDDASLRIALIAIQGPDALGILQPLADVDLESLRYYAIAEGHAAGVPAWIARTGYTGEDGFELFVDVDDASSAWDSLLEAGTGDGLRPAGLGARDTLRLEAGMALYGNELDRVTNPLEAGLERLVREDKKGDYVGREALERARADGPRKSLVGLVVRGRGIARHGHPLYRPGDPEPCGVVTSGTASPTVGKPIAMGYLPPAASEPGTMVEVGIRGGRVAAEVVPLPFYRRPERASPRGAA